MGHWSYLAFYLLTGIGAAVTQVLIDRTSTIPMVGASGAIAGVMGAYIVHFPKGLIRISLGAAIASRGLAIPAYVLIALWFVQQLLNGIASLGGTAQAAPQPAPRGGCRQTRSAAATSHELPWPVLDRPP